jgi:hypothetical protein
MTGQQLRAMQVSEFCQWLASRTNQEKRPFQQETITAYKVAARALDAWMASQGLEEDFTACDTGVINRFFRDYHAGHGQGGTNTKQRNLRHLFTWLEAEYDHPHPYTDDLNRYAPVKVRPSTLSLDFIKDLTVEGALSHCGGLRPLLLPHEVGDCGQSGPHRQLPARPAPANTGARPRSAGSSQDQRTAVPRWTRSHHDGSRTPGSRQPPDPAPVPPARIRERAP